MKLVEFLFYLIHSNDLLNGCTVETLKIPERIRENDYSAKHGDGALHMRASIIKIR